MPHNKETTIADRRWPLPDEAATIAVAAKLAPVTRVGDLIALWGGLGVGKTVFARGFIRARGGQDEDVPSPTFTLVQIYEARPPYRGPVWHFDLFRLKSAEEAYELGIEDAFAEAICLIEWPERILGLLPAERLDVNLAMAASGGGRTLTLRGGGDWPRRLAEIDLA